MAVVRGVDGCPAGWLAVSLDTESGVMRQRVHPDAAALFSVTADVTAIDIPIGLSADGSRGCDERARALLRARRNSVFPPPARAVLDSTSYMGACEASRSARNKAISQQSYALLPKIRDVDRALRDGSVLVSTVHEVHPEVCFYFLNQERPMRYAKKTGFGFQERFGLLESQFPGQAVMVREAIAPGHAADDDILDAFAALWTAMRILRGDAVRVNPFDERDDFGLPMQMWA